MKQMKQPYWTCKERGKVLICGTLEIIDVCKTKDKRLCLSTLLELINLFPKGVWLKNFETQCIPSTVIKKLKIKKGNF
jgi:hypothetical protein